MNKNIKILKLTQDPYMDHFGYRATALDEEGNDYQIHWTNLDNIDDPDFINWEDFFISSHQEQKIRHLRFKIEW